MGYYYYYYNDKHPEENSDLEVLSELLGSVENEIVEFKAASNGFDFHKLGQYFSAISNEANLKNKRFGWLVFGVHDTTHAILGTNYKNNATALEKLKHDIIDYLKKWEKGKKADFDKLLLDKLPDSMTEKQKKDKIRNLLAALRAAEVIKTDSPNRQTSNWILNK